MFKTLALLFAGAATITNAQFDQFGYGQQQQQQQQHQQRQQIQQRQYNGQFGYETQQQQQQQQRQQIQQRQDNGQFGYEAEQQQQQQQQQQQRQRQQVQQRQNNGQFGYDSHQQQQRQQIQQRQNIRTGQLQGGYTPAEMTPANLEMLRVGLSSAEHKKHSGKSICVNRVIALETQVVEGMNYKYRLNGCEMPDGQFKPNCDPEPTCAESQFEVVVLTRPWTNTVEVSSITRTP